MSFGPALSRVFLLPLTHGQSFIQSFPYTYMRLQEHQSLESPLSAQAIFFSPPVLTDFADVVFTRFFFAAMRVEDECRLDKGVQSSTFLSCCWGEEISQRDMR